MNKILGAALGALMATGSVNATAVLGFRGAMGIDINSIKVGDIFRLELFASGSAGDNLRAGTGTNLEASGGVAFLNYAVGPNVTADFSTSPTLYVFNFKATAIGAAAVQFSNFTINSILATYPALSTTLNLNVQPATASVPEPATWAMFVGGFGLIGAAMRRRQRINVSFT